MYLAFFGVARQLLLLSFFVVVGMGAKQGLLLGIELERGQGLEWELELKWALLLALLLGLLVPY